MTNSPASSTDRRTVLRGIGTLVVAGAIAGCGGDGGDGGDGEDGGTPTPPSPDATVSSGGVSRSEAEEWAAESSNHDGVVDRTGQDVVEVTVGAEGNNGNFAFGPTAIEVSTGTIVRWEWNGKGAGHNVVAEGGEFDSGTAVEEAGTTYVAEFTATGAWRYVCEPHEALGMKGAVIVS